MWVKYLCVASLVSVVCGGSVPDSRGLDKGRSIGSSYSGENSPSPMYELPCTSQGGICLQKHECPEGKLGMKGLCPIQQDQGVECCHSVGKSSITCGSRGGECMDLSTNCPPNLTFMEASDCGKYEKCCILVN